MYINISSGVYATINNSVNICLTGFKYIYIIAIVNERLRRIKKNSSLISNLKIYKHNFLTQNVLQSNIIIYLIIDIYN